MEVQKSNLSAFAVHPSAPILASGLWCMCVLYIYACIVYVCIVYACIVCMRLCVCIWVYILCYNIITSALYNIIYDLLQLVCIYEYLLHNCLHMLLYSLYILYLALV